MPKNQLFKVNPDQTILNQLLGVFGLEDISRSADLFP